MKKLDAAHTRFNCNNFFNLCPLTGSQETNVEGDTLLESKYSCKHQMYSYNIILILYKLYNSTLISKMCLD